jgi:hypothetical protein
MNLENKTRIFDFVVLLVLALGVVVTDFYERRSSEELSVRLAVRNNLWDHYGSKSVKSKMYQIEKNHLNILANSTKDETQRSLLQINVSNLNREIERYDKEQDDIQKDAQEADKQFEIAKRKASYFSIALMVNQFILFVFVAAIFLNLNRRFYGSISLIAIVANTAFLIYNFLRL